MNVIGIDIGGTGIKIGVAEHERVFERAYVPTRPDSDYRGILSDILSIARSFVEKYDARRVGIGSCGLIDSAKGTVCYSNNVRWEGVSLKKDISEALGLPTAIANDAKCAALGEALYGAGKDFSRVLTLTLGTGVGGGFVVRRRLNDEDRYADAAEIFGHITLEKNGRQCTCGRSGCMEAYCSAVALRKRAKELYKRELDACEIFFRARKHEGEAETLVNEFSEYLADGAVSLANAYRPEVIVFGGGVSASADLFLPLVNKALEREVFGFAYAPVKGVAAELGTDAGLIGAAALL